MAGLNSEFYWTAEQWCSWLEQDCNLPEIKITGATQDTRQLQAGDAYIAIKGENFDGHKFVQQAKDAGAALALVSELQPIDLPQILVPDTRLALAELSKKHRESLDITIIGITGSNGKTTTKEMLAYLLAEAGAVWATQGNLNNDLGVPLTLLQLRPEHRFGVIEMGANHPQEIDFLTHLAQPNLAVITLAAPAHLEGFGSLETIVQTKAEIFNGLRSTGLGERPLARGVINADSAGFEFWQKKLKELGKDLVSYGQNPLADAQISQIKTLPSGISFNLTLAGKTHQVELGILGEHNAWNASAALQVSVQALGREGLLGLDLASLVSRIKSFRNTSGRLQVYKLQENSVLIDDSYNANPSSVAAAIKTLAQQDGYKVLCLGQMGELGETAAELHKEVGKLAAQAGIDEILSFGDLTQFTLDGFAGLGELPLERGVILNHQAQVERLEKLLGDKPQVSILVKGSRSAQMDKVVSQLLERIKNVTLA